MSHRDPGQESRGASGLSRAGPVPQTPKVRRWAGFILNDTVKYDKNYQYDVIGITDYLLTNQSTIWYQNMFNATSDEIIAAFSTYFDRQSNFTVEIYVNGELKLTQNGSSEAGYFIRLLNGAYRTAALALFNRLSGQWSSADQAADRCLTSG